MGVSLKIVLRNNSNSLQSKVGRLSRTLPQQDKAAVKTPEPGVH